MSSRQNSPNGPPPALSLGLLGPPPEVGLNMGSPPDALELLRADQPWPYFYRRYRHLNPLSIDMYNRTPLYYARSVEAIHHLMEHGSDLFHRDNQGKTFLHFLFSEQSDADYYHILREIARFAIDHYGSEGFFRLMDAQDNLGNTVLHYAVMNGNIPLDAFRFLTKRIEFLKNNQGMEAIDLAREKMITHRDVDRNGMSDSERYLSYSIIITQEDDRRKRRDYDKQFVERGKAAAILNQLPQNLPEDVVLEMLKYLKPKKKKSKKKPSKKKSAKKSVKKSLRKK